MKGPDGFGMLSGGVTPFDGNFASLFPGAFAVVQSDLGVNYGAVMRPNETNTSGVAFALTGAAPDVPVPIWIKITAPGLANIYYDGLGVTPVRTGAPVFDSASILLTGAAAGLAITPGVGSQVPGDIWKATCARLNDQSGNNNNFRDPGFGYQPLTIANGPNGVVCLSANSGPVVQQALGAVAMNLPAPSATPYYSFAAFRLDTNDGGGGSIIGNIDLGPPHNDVRVIGTTGIATLNPTQVDLPASITLGQWYFMELKRSNNAADYFRVGALQTAGNAGNGATVTPTFGRDPGHSVGVASSFLLHGFTPNEPNWTAVRAAVTAKYGPAVRVFP